MKKNNHLKLFILVIIVVVLLFAITASARRNKLYYSPGFMPDFNDPFAATSTKDQFGRSKTLIIPKSYGQAIGVCEQQRNAQKQNLCDKSRSSSQQSCSEDLQNRTFGCLDKVSAHRGSLEGAPAPWKNYFVTLDTDCDTEQNKSKAKCDAMNPYSQTQQQKACFASAKYAKVSCEAQKVHLSALESCEDFTGDSCNALKGSMAELCNLKYDPLIEDCGNATSQQNRYQPRKVAEINFCAKKHSIMKEVCMKQIPGQMQSLLSKKGLQLIFKKQKRQGDQQFVTVEAFEELKSQMIDMQKTFSEKLAELQNQIEGLKTRVRLGIPVVDGDEIVESTEEEKSTANVRTTKRGRRLGRKYKF